MATRVHRFDLTSAKDSPFPNTTTNTLTFPPGQVTAFSIEIPAGHAGKTGLAIDYGTFRVIPYDGTAFVKGNGKTVRYELDDPKPGGRGWFAEHFNADRYAHTFHVAVELEELATNAALLPPVILLRYGGESIATGAPAGEPIPVPGGGGTPGGPGPIPV